MNRRDLLLNEMGITQWVLTKPQVLQGDAQIRLSEEVKLVVVCEEDHRQSRLFADILQTLRLQKHQYQWLAAEQSHRLVFSHSPIIWLIQNEDQAVEFAKNFANQTAWYHGSWQELGESSHKRRLWRQIDTFFADLEKKGD